MILLEKFIDVDDFCKVCYLLGNTYYLKTVPGATWTVLGGGTFYTCLAAPKSNCSLV